MASGSILTGHCEKATGQNSWGKEVEGYGSTRQEAADNCRKEGSVTTPQVVKK